MKNLPLMFFGIFFLLSASWCGVVLSANLQLSGLQPDRMDDGDPVFPNFSPGVALQGRQTYIELGCEYCHTQQVRPASLQLVFQPRATPDKPAKQETQLLSPDIARGWAERGSVARDYIFQSPVLLGNVRRGPDLTDFGDRKASTADVLLHLYNARLIAPDSNMPPYRFLFKTQPIANGQPSLTALKFPPNAPGAPAAGTEVVPTERAIELAAYLQNLKLNYDLPEAKAK